ncbi:hypothetical protein PPL_05754 [Heterostelium album PN500]|uniref:F-box domain-containing protein n=1 Tax=Heterostelium pallidum (strain ATCC 26659 / Pp 5 / PN500) TaxID=670386 RepID=D3BB22_HETP5|nr:hypothetical protein PPL_05754 [Heterostelium album PN500]EFA81759.1 hypothetical protein PPL_05754 [Heterostelium album PN500]|eukprot:XP_020433876.1 hypothetical protein PPL_05754 [Heterostelium album PN500]
MEQNKGHQLVNLSFLLLGYIVDRLPNIDKICFSLACKRWFENKDRYLIFNVDDIGMIDNEQNKTSSFHLKSYQSIYLKSHQLRTNLTLFIGKKSCCPPTNLYLDNDILNTLDSLQPNITSVMIDETINHNMQTVEIDSYHLCRLLSTSNVTELRCCRTLTGKLPDSIRVLSFYNDFNEVVKRNSLPSGLKVLELKDPFNKPIDVGILPEGLERVEFGRRYSHPIGPGILPRTLKHLDLGGNLSTLLAGSLPPNLEVLIFSSAKDQPIISLPTSLHTIYWLPATFIPSLEKLPNLTTLTTYEGTGLSGVINDLPPTLTDLTVGRKYQLLSAMPPSIRYLNLDRCTYDYGQLFPETTQYRLQQLVAQRFPAQKPNLQILNLMLMRGVNNPTFTEGAESLDMTFNLHNTLSAKAVPKSIKLLKMYSMDSLDSIPTSIETLEIFNRWKSLSKPLPPALRNIVYIEVSGLKRCDIRRLDDNCFLVIGQPPMMKSSKKFPYGYTMAMFNQSEFKDRFYQTNK